MRYFEISSNVRIPISCEEQEIIDEVEKGKFKAEDERVEEVVRLMVSRGILLKDKEGNITTNHNRDLWRI